MIWYRDTQNIFRSPIIYSESVHNVCTEYINTKFLFYLVSFFFGFCFFCVSNVIEKSLADSRRAGRPINPFMIMIKDCQELDFSLH